MATVLITGGAGFIGSRLALHLCEQGQEVRILDNLLPQVHRPGAAVPGWMTRDCDVRVADISDREAVRSAHAGLALSALMLMYSLMKAIKGYEAMHALDTAGIAQKNQDAVNELLREFP